MKLSFGNRIKAGFKILATGETNSIQEYIRKFLAGDDVPNIDSPVDHETALKYSAVFSCCRVLAETFASVPLILYKKNGEDREPVTDNILYDMMHNAPNPEMAAFNFKEALMNAVNLGGNAVCERLYNARGELVGLYPYPQSMVKIDRDKTTRKLIYSIENGAKSKELTRLQVVHIPGMTLDGVIGLSPISYAARAITLGMSYESFGINFYNNSANPSGAFEKEGELSKNAFDRLRKELKDNYQGLKRTGTPMILEEGMKWHQMTVNPIDAQLIESKYFQIEDICRIYRVPQHLVNKLDRSTNNNIEEQALEFVMYTMLPIFKRFEECYNAQILTPEQRAQGFFFEHKMDGLLRADIEKRGNFYAKGRMWGWFTINNILRMENMKGIGPEGDKRLQPANQVEIGSGQENAVNAKVLNEIEAILRGAKS